MALIRYISARFGRACKINRDERDIGLSPIILVSVVGNPHWGGIRRFTASADLIEVSNSQ